MVKSRLIVKKFGGTSVGNSRRLLSVADIVRRTASSNPVVVVLSAMSGETKAQGTTNRLLKMAEEVLKGNSAGYKQIMEQIKDHHFTTSKESIPNPQLLEETLKDIQIECDKLGSFLEAAEVIGEISARSRDVIIGVGEKLSCRIFTSVLAASGVDAVYINLDRVIEKHFFENQLDHSFYSYLRDRFKSIIQEHLKAGRTPVVTGFFGFVPGGILDAVGRGYTDFTASLIASAFGAEEFQIWKEVDGIYTADPRKVPKARVLKSITPAEAAELTFYGSEVIHPFTMEQAIAAKIPIRIKNTFNPNFEGTLIDPVEKSDSFETQKYPTAVTVKSNVTLINVSSNRKSLAHGFMANIFQILEKYGIALDLISTSEINVSMAVCLTERETQFLPAILIELEALGKVSVNSNMAIVSLVGQQMKSLVGIAGKFFSALAVANVNIEVISQGASEINISCVVEGSAADKAIVSIHDSLILPHLLTN